MESSHERPCPSCSAPAKESQRWCLECGAELPQASRRSTLKPIVGIATTLTVLVGAASAAGYTLLQDGKQPPPPATTVAQQPPPPAVTTPPVDTTTPPPADDALADTGDDLTLPADRGAGTGAGSGGGTGSGGGGTSTPPPVDNTVPDYSSDVDTSTPNPPPPDDDAGEVDSGDDGSVTDDRSAERRAERRAAEPVLRETNIALGAVAVPYAPYASGDEDLGDAGAIVDGSSSTSWRTPIFEDPAAHPQLGVYVDLASVERLTKLVVTTPTPGMSFEVYTARSGPPKSITAAGWSHLATKTNSPGKTTIDLPAGTTARYVLLWVSGLPAGRDHAAVSELQIFSRQPV